MPTGAFNICCPRDCTLNPLRDDSALRALSTLGGLRGAPEVPPLCRETQSLGQQMLNAPVGINGLNTVHKLCMHKYRIGPSPVHISYFPAHFRSSAAMRELEILSQVKNILIQFLYRQLAHFPHRSPFVTKNKKRLTLRVSFSRTESFSMTISF